MLGDAWLRGSTASLVTVIRTGDAAASRGRWSSGSTVDMLSATALLRKAASAGLDVVTVTSTSEVLSFTWAFTLSARSSAVSSRP